MRDDFDLGGLREHVEGCNRDNEKRDCKSAMSRPSVGGLREP
jgi:hypothetical protein